MKNPMSILESVREFVAQVPDLHAYQIQTYSAQNSPTDRNLREVMNGMLPATVLIAYTGSSIGSLGQSYHWLHRFSLLCNYPSVDQNVAAVTTLINGKPADNYLPFLESVIDADCDPPGDIQVTPHMLTDSIEIWELTFSLRESL
jgi:hypothetical protein